jgi:two-component system response regulator HydG
MSDTILLIDDDASFLREVGEHLEALGHEVARELDLDAGLGACDRFDPHACVLDVGATGLTSGAIEELRRRGVPVIALLDGPDDAQAEAALARGAVQVLARPAGAGVIATACIRAAEASRRWRAAAWGERDATPESAAAVVSLGTSPALRAVASQIQALAQSDRASLLIRGEPGVGKRWVARLIHAMGPRADQPFLSLSTGADDPVTLESLLFGHERGAVVNAPRRSRGVFELAGGGTVVLREVGGLPAELQPLLLRVLETRTLRRVGGQRDVPIAARVIATSSADLPRLVDEGVFREDLHYRLSTTVLDLPPVRERSDHDRLVLIRALVARLDASLPEPLPPIDPGAMDRLVAHAWPGNVAEIVNVLERAALLARLARTGAVLVEHLPGELRARPGLGDRRHQPMTMDELERMHIERTLRFHGGNRTRAAKELRISRATLINKIKRYGLTE